MRKLLATLALLLFASAAQAQNYLQDNGTFTSVVNAAADGQLLYRNSGLLAGATVGSGLNLSGGTLTSTGLGGTVTSVSVVTANGVSGTVANPTTTPAITLTLGAITPSLVTVTSSSASALAVGLNGATNPAFDVDASAALQVCGLKVKGDATGGTVSLTATDSGATCNVSVNAKGSGTIPIGNVSSGQVQIGDGGGGLRVTNSFTATGLVTNADLANPATTVNGQTCTLGSTCTVTAAPSGSAGGDLTGTYPNPTLAGVITAGGPTGSATVAPIITYDAKGRLTTVTSATITPAIGSVTGLGTGIATALGTNVGTAGAPVINGGALGTPSSGTATNLSGTAASLTAGTVTTNANLTGPITSSGNATAIASQTGTGTKFVVDTSPVIVTPAITTTATLSRNGIAATSTDGYVIQNTTAAAAGAQQWSPRVHWIGQGWKTTATAASQTVDWIAELQPIQGATTPTSVFALSEQDNALGYNPVLQLSPQSVIPTPTTQIVTTATSLLTAASGVTPISIIKGTGAAGAWQGFFAFGNTFNINAFFAYQANGTSTLPTLVTAGNTLFQIAASGYDGSVYGGTTDDDASITFATAETFSTSAHGTGIFFSTTPKTTKVKAQAMLLNASGGLSIGNSTDPGIGSLQLNAQMFMPSITTSSAAQTGTVCWTTGTGKFTVDTTVGCLTSIMAAKNITEHLSPRNALDIVSRLDPFAFRYKKGWGDSGQYEQFGFGAEEVMQVDERLVGRDPEGKLSGVRYQEMTAVLAGAIQQLQLEVQQLKRGIQ